ncbi:astacin [Ancylostoma ceylanicum]|uniref:Zinc metalloproteinase n=1 Tax=Ancylostoma ceylanicum TaxID=53326 RepID=A0A0D6LJC2_9BILA|nr:astacin [Ancylostoma ceylanicum]
MRLAFLFLLLVVCANAGIFDSLGAKIKSIFTGANGLGEKLKKALNVTCLVRVHEKLKKIKDKAMKALQLTPAMLKSLKERLKKLRPIKKDHFQEVGDSITEINEKSGIGELLYQGDMVLSEIDSDVIITIMSGHRVEESQCVSKTQADEVAEDIEEEVNGTSRTKRQAFKDKWYTRRLWSEGVNYYFDRSASEKMRTVFIKAAEQWHNNTCINFQESDRTEDKLYVFAETGCWSNVGRRGGKQSLSLGQGCESVGVALHELGHTLGFFHTMSRHDRDDYVTINSENVKDDWHGEFTKETERTNYNYGLGYDYGSVMHYGIHAGSRNKKPTMVPVDIDHQETIGSEMLSFVDISMMNEHYGCKELCDPRKSARCENGGFPHPRRCSECICPGGYGGRTCAERPRGCGDVIEATSDWAELQDVLGHGTKSRDDFEKCNYWITSPPNTQIQVRIVSFTKGVAVDGCYFAGVEIKTNEDQTLTGYRFCAPEDAGVTLTSYSNLVPIITYNRAFPTKTVLEFRYGKHPILITEAQVLNPEH